MHKIILGTVAIRKTLCFVLLIAGCCVAVRSQNISVDSASPKITGRKQESGSVNRSQIRSEVPLSAASKIPVNPTREELEQIKHDGLVIVSVSRGAGQKGLQEAALASTLKAYVDRETPEDASAIDDYVESHPESHWTPGLRVTQGVHRYHEGRFSEALESFELAWTSLKSSQDPKIREASVAAAAELAGLYARLGRFEDLRTLLREVEGRPISGPATEKIRMAAEGLESMTRFPEHSYKCGPFALRTIRDFLNLQPATHLLIEQAESTPKGLSLAELQTLAGEMKMDWVAATRQPGARLPLPVLIHWKVGHYGAVLKEMEDGRFLVRDPTFMHDFLIAPDTLEKESSGNYLIPRSALGKGWMPLSEGKASEIYGKGAPGSKDNDDGPRDGTICSKGMAFYSFDFFKAGLVIEDLPLGYSPPYGPAIDFHLTYNQRGEQFLSSTTSSFGPKWTINWFSYLQQSDSAGNVVLFLRDGRRETHFWDSSLGQFSRQKRSMTQLVRISTSPLIYERRSADGSKETYSRVVSASPWPKVLLTSISDPQGNTATLAYDASNRVNSITDSLGQTSNLYYENSSFPHLVTKISDPFIVGGQRRSALFEYTSTGRLAKITDPEGIESTFLYNSIQQDFIDRLKTPYGSTAFSTNPVTAGNNQFVEVTDHLSRKERVEYRHSLSLVVPGTDPAPEVPDSALIQSKNSYLYYGNTLYWDKKTYAHYPPNPETGLNYDKAVRWKWMWHATVTGRTVGVISSIKKPLESRIWFEYPNQVSGTFAILMGDSEQPTKIGRRLETGETQVTEYAYNGLGLITRHTDPMGRTRVWEYDTNEVDVKFIKQKNGLAYETLAALIYLPSDPPRRPHSLTDAAGQITTFAWNARGQILVKEQPNSLTTNWQYNTAGYLSSLNGPLSGSADTIYYGYDDYGRLGNITQPGNYTLTYDYDSLDRPTKVTYPDGSTEEFAYHRPNGDKILDLTRYKDRENRWTLFAYNALREKVSMIDPLQRSTFFNWCYCGALQDLYDAEGNHTHWDYDIGGRLVGKKYADGSEHVYTYDLTGRLETVTDAKEQVKTHTYYRDDRLAGISYSNAQIPTPNVGFDYDPVYGRVSQMDDGIGTTSYIYHPVDGSTLGAGKLHTINGPLNNDTISYTYDILGRFKSRSINGTANSVVIDTYDALGRVEQLTNPLGAFSYTYDPVNLMLDTVTAPNGLISGYSYYPNTGDLRLQEIEHQTASSAPVASHAYTYDATGNIKTWAQTKDGGSAKTWHFDYDRADQLEAGSLIDAANPPAPVEQLAWRYDRTGNRVSRQDGTHITRSEHNNLNQITSEQGGGWMRFRGETSEPSLVTIQSNGNLPVAATIDSDNGFTAWVEMNSGSNTITIEATDSSPNANVKTNQYQVTVSGDSRSVIHDLNGNITNNGAGHTYAWDAENRLVKITYADSSSTEFIYDGTSRMVRTLKKNSGGSVTETRNFVWDGMEIAEQRSDSNAVVRRYYSGGYVTGTSSSPSDAEKFYYLKDHLGSVRVVYGEEGVQVYQDYDPYGRMTLTPNVDDAPADFGYTGHYYHNDSGLVLAPYRAYDPENGRWLSRDPIGENGGINLYRYVSNNPINYVDPDGRIPLPVLGFIAGAGLDIAGQLISNGGDWGNLNIGQAAVSGLAGATGAGLGTGVAKLGLGLAGRTALNAFGSAAIGAGAQAGNNALSGRCLDEGLGNAALINGVLGGAGSLASDAVTGLSNSISRHLANQAFDSAPLPQKLFGISNAIQTPPTTGSGIGVGIANGLGVTVSNAGPLLGP